jgi:hypothetical protein
MKILLATILGQDIYQNEDLTFSYMGRAEVDADGSPRAYAPSNSGLPTLDSLLNAKDGNLWCGIVTDSDGYPIVQSQSDPAPGYYVSTTSLQHQEYPKEDPRRYVDSENVPYAVINGAIARKCRGIVLGSRCTIQDTDTGQTIETVVADTGPSKKLGEMSIKSAALLGLDSSAKTGGSSSDRFLYSFFPNQPADGYQLQSLT